MSFIYFIVGMTVCLLGLQFIVWRVERRMVWPYSELASSPPSGIVSDYASTWIEDALKNGFEMLGWSQDQKGPNYRIAYAFLVSPNRDTMAIIGTGSLMSIPVRGTWLHTPNVDRRHSNYSTDNQTCVEVDLAKEWVSHLATEKSFTKLWQRHQEWLQQIGAKPHGFPPGSEVATFRMCREEHFHSMARQGLVYFLGENKTLWRYTTLGAMKGAVLNYFVGMLRAVTFGHFPKGA